MTLQDTAKIELTGYEIAVALGCLHYIYDYKNIGKNVVYLISLIKKLENADNKL